MNAGSILAIIAALGGLVTGLTALVRASTALAQVIEHKAEPHASPDQEQQH